MTNALSECIIPHILLELSHTNRKTANIFLTA